MATILIFEDNAELALHWQEILEAEQHIVSCCSTISVALTVIQKRRPELLVVDMLIKEGGQILPEGGLTLLGRLQTMNISSYSPAVLGVSGHKPGPYLRNTALDIAKSMGLDMALYKPISSVQLSESVEYLLASKGFS